MKRRPVYVAWDDHVLHPGTFDPAQVSALKLSVCETVGWLVDEDDEALCIAQTIGDGTEATDVLVVSKAMLRRRKFLDGAPTSA